MTSDPVASLDNEPLPPLAPRACQPSRARRTLPARWPTCLVLVWLLLALVPRARAQCDGTWLPTGAGTPGVDRTVLATINWDPDGPGPSPPLLIVGGSFAYAGHAAAARIAAWDGSAWS